MLRLRTRWSLGWLIAAVAAFLALIAAGAAGLGFLAGFEVSARQFPPYSIMAKIDEKLGELFGAKDVVTSSRIATHLLDLDTDVGVVPDLTPDPDNWSELANIGGGITSFGADVLVLPYSGKIFAATSGSDIRETNVRAPDNGRAAYQAILQTPEYKAKYSFNLGYLRYNDILFVDAPAFRGLVASYIEFDAEHVCYTNTLAVLPIAAGVASIDQVTAGPEDWRVLYRTKPCLPFKDKYLAMEGQLAGGRTAFRAPNTLYLASGDFHWDGMRSNTELISQNPTAEYGKVIEIDIATGEGRVVSMGHRNMQGIAIDKDGRLLVVEHGPRGGDELNIVKEGANYGWPLESYGTTYSGLRIPSADSFGRHDHYEPPIYAWVPSVATSGMTLIDGFNEAWDGDLLIASLVGQSLFRVRMQGDQAVYAEQIPVGTRIRAVHQHTDGRIVLWTDKQQLIFITPSQRQAEGDFIADYIDAAKLSGAMKNKLALAIDTCGTCHSFVAGDDAKAPSLARIYGADIASTGYAGYSRALKAKRGRWDRDALEAFIADPDGFAPGAAMPNPGVDDPQVRAEVVSLLQEMEHSF